jgi:alginate O-acetyltransferase complex protein AlgI
MIAGPIVRFASIADQIENRAYKVSDRLIGLNRFCIGLAKKVLIANVMGQYADSIIDGDQLNTVYAWIGILAYTFQIYFDFSGYSDMAIGLGRMMGFRFPENFESPYTSRNITEFWGRWHITLGEWMRDYLYIPLGGNRVNTKARLYFNLSFVFLISGLWHGASWNFILWGAFHGLFLILDRLFLMKLLNKLGRPIAIISTFFVTVLGWVFFRIEDYGEAMNYLNEMFSVSSSTVEIVLKKEFWLSFALAILFSFLVYFPLGEKLRAWFFDKNEYSSKQYIYLTALSLALFTLSVSAIANTDFNPFIYFRF